MKTNKWLACVSASIFGALIFGALVFSAAELGSAAEANGVAGPKIVVSIFPLHALASGVMAGAGTPALLLDSGLSPHDFALKPSQARLLQAADLLVWIGDGLEFPLARFAANLPPGRSLPLTAGGGANGRNLHIWLDPDQARQIVRVLAEKLAALDPDHAALYAANGAALRRRIAELADELETLLRPFRDLPYIVYHDAYGPFERRFGLRNLAAVTPDPERRPGARHIRRMRAAIAASGARCLFREPQFEPQILAAIVEGSDIQLGELDPLGVGLTPGVNGYFDLMRNLARGFVRCLSRP
jgi:zinc transport system substrate-binding protein